MIRLLSLTMSIFHWQPNDETKLPNEDERLRTLEAIEELEKELEVQRRRTMAALEMYDYLADENEELEWLLYARRAYLAPVRRLNADIIGLIACEMANLDDKAPWKMATICRSWRQAVIATPKAWCRVRVDDVDNPQDLLRTALSRTGQCPLYISMGPLTKREDWSGCRQIVREQRERVIQIDAKELPTDFQRGGDYLEFPKLSAVSLRCAGGPTSFMEGQYMGVNDFISIFSAMELPLRSLVLQGYSLQYLNLWGVFRHLTSLHFINCNLLDFHLIMGFCSKTLLDLRLVRTTLIESNSLALIGTGGPNPVPFANIWSFEVLESLEYYDDRAQAFPLLFPRLQSPRLSRLMYGYLRPPIFDDVPDALVSLDISYWRPTSTKKVDVLLQRDCFQKLTIHYGWDDFVKDVILDHTLIPSKVKNVDLVAILEDIMGEPTFQQMLEVLKSREIIIRVLEPYFNGFQITLFHTSRCE